MLPPSPSIFPVDEAGENSSNSECEKCNKFDQKLNSFRQQSEGGEGGREESGCCSHRGQLTRQNAARRQAFEEHDSGLSNRFRRWLHRTARGRHLQIAHHLRTGSSPDGGTGSGDNGDVRNANKSYEFLQEVAAVLESSQQHHREHGLEQHRKLVSSAPATTVRCRNLRRALLACVAWGIVALLIVGGSLLTVGHVLQHRPAVTAGAILVISGAGLLLYSCCASTKYQSQNKEWNKEMHLTDPEQPDDSTVASPGPLLRLHQPQPGRPYLSMGAGTVASSRQGSLYSLGNSAVPGELRLCRGNSITDMMHDTVPACLHRHHQHQHQRHRPSLAATIPLPL